jgi:hypothetical protein
MSEQDNASTTDSPGTNSHSSTELSPEATNPTIEAGGDSSGSPSTSPAGEQKPVTFTQEQMDELKAAHEADKAKLADVQAQLELSNREKLSEQERAVVEAGDKVRNELTPELEKFKATVEGYLEAEIESLPEDKRDLVPDLPIEAKLKWIKDAKAKGLFGEPKATSSTAITPGKTPSNSGNVDRASLKPGTKEYDAYMQSKYGIKPKTSFY